MTDIRAECLAIRGRIVDRWLSGEASPPHPAEERKDSARDPSPPEDSGVPGRRGRAIGVVLSEIERRHLEGCPSCARYLEGVNRIPELFPAAELYTPALRRRTLEAVSGHRRGVPAWLAPFLVPASALSVACSIVGPVWLLDTLLRPYFVSSWPALALALVVSGSTALVTWGSALALWKVRFGSGTPSRAAGVLNREVSRV